MKLEIDNIEVWEAVADAVKEAHERCYDELSELEKLPWKTTEELDAACKAIVDRANLYAAYLLAWDKQSIDALKEACMYVKKV